LSLLRVAAWDPLDTGDEGESHVPQGEHNFIRVERRRVRSKDREAERERKREREAWRDGTGLAGHWR
jgi:hypothetical protein